MNELMNTPIPEVDLWDPRLPITEVQLKYLMINFFTREDSIARFSRPEERFSLAELDGMGQLPEYKLHGLESLNWNECILSVEHEKIDPESPLEIKILSINIEGTFDLSNIHPKSNYYVKDLETGLMSFYRK